MNRTRLLFVAEELAVNGASMSLLSLLSSLPRERYEISLFVFNHNGELMNRIPEDVHLLPERLCYAVHRLPLKVAVKRALRQGRLDLVLYRILVSFQRALKSNYRLWSFLSDITEDYDAVCSYEDGFTVPMIANKVKHGKKCSWIHIPYSKYPQLPFVNKAFSKIDVCVPVSSFVGKDLTGYLVHETAPQHIVHNIIDADVCNQRAQEPCELPKAGNTMRIVSVGRITPAKGFDIIPDTAQLLEQKGIDFEWIVIGGGQDGFRLQQEANEKCTKGRVQFVGNKSNPMPWVKSADVVVQPSMFESWGMMVSEALCLGKAVITSDIPAFKEQIKDGVNGIMRAYKPSVMAEAIGSVLTKTELRKSLETNAANYPFTKDSVIKEFDILIKNLLNK